MKALPSEATNDTRSRMAYHKEDPDANGTILIDNLLVSFQNSASARPLS